MVSIGSQAACKAFIPAIGFPSHFCNNPRQLCHTCRSFCSGTASGEADQAGALPSPLPPPNSPFPAGKHLAFGGEWCRERAVCGSVTLPTFPPLAVCSDQLVSRALVALAKSHSVSRRGPHTVPRRKCGSSSTLITPPMTLMTQAFQLR